MRSPRTQEFAGLDGSTDRWISPPPTNLTAVSSHRRQVAGDRAGAPVHILVEERRTSKKARSTMAESK